MEKRRKNTQHERSRDKKHLQKYSALDVTLNNNQHEEMCTLVEKISENGSTELESVIIEADKSGVGSAIRSIWDSNLATMKKEFNVVATVYFCFYM